MKRTFNMEEYPVLEQGTELEREFELRGKAREKRQETEELEKKAGAIK